MSSKMSLYLDFLRVLASFLVLFSHMTYERFSSNLITTAYGHEAVMIFFVMSGYVIAYVADNKENTFRIFMINRFARLYSVVIIALLITPIFDYFGTIINEAIYQDNVAWDYVFIRLFANTFYLQELWFLNIRYFGNGPLWSLGFEFWYYVLFALITLFHHKYKTYLILVLCIFLGPKILLYGLIWYLGVLAFKIHSKYSNINVKEGGNLLMIVLFLLTVIIFVNKDLWHDYLKVDIKYLQNIFTDYLIGIIVFLNILLVKYITIGLNLNVFSRLIKYFASISFALYLFHYPLLFFYAGILETNISTSFFKLLLLFCLIVGTVAILAYISEFQKYRYKRFFTYLLDKGFKK